jgi:hypothetical protein
VQRFLPEDGEYDQLIAADLEGYEQVRAGLKNSNVVVRIESLGFGANKLVISPVPEMVEPRIHKAPLFGPERGIRDARVFRNLKIQEIFSHEGAPAPSSNRKSRSTILVNGPHS